MCTPARCPRAGRPRTYIYGRPRAAPTDTDYYSYFHTMARRLELPFWVVLGRGSYTSPITAPVAEVCLSLCRGGARERRELARLYELGRP